MRALVTFVLLVTGCYASHTLPRDGGEPDAGGACELRYLGCTGPVTCRIERLDHACSDLARCICLDRLGAPTDAALAACIEEEGTLRNARVTLADVCDPFVPAASLPGAIETYFEGGMLTGPGCLRSDVTSTPACASVPARF